MYNTTIMYIMLRLDCDNETRFDIVGDSADDIFRRKL